MLFLYLIFFKPLLLIFHLAEIIYESKIPINNSQKVVTTLILNVIELEPDGTLILSEGVGVEETVELLEP